jgi:hypothetical protein
VPAAAPTPTDAEDADVSGTAPSGPSADLPRVDPPGSEGADPNEEISA